jgi:hypothetical protein
MVSGEQHRAVAAEKGSRRRALGKSTNEFSAFPEVGSFQMCGCESIRGRLVLANSLAGPSTAQNFDLLIHVKKYIASRFGVPLISMHANT